MTKDERVTKLRETAEAYVQLYDALDDLDEGDRLTIFVTEDDFKAHRECNSSFEADCNDVADQLESDNAEV